MKTYSEAPKAPRWINTEAGHWAWQELVAWRRQAADALSVQQRSELLHEAEQLQGAYEASSDR